MILENKNIKQTNINITEYYQQCKALAQINSKKIDVNNYSKYFHSQNKIIKHILFNLLTNLSEINNIIISKILTIFQESKIINSKNL